MPELPEVETVRRAMERHLLGRGIEAVRTSAKRLRQPLPRHRLANLVGDRFIDSRRRAKFLLLGLESERVLLIHLGMSGNLLFGPGQDTHDHVVWTLDKGPSLVYSDPRRFGMVLVLYPPELEVNPFLAHLGPEPLGDIFDGTYLHACCKNSRRPIKNLIMDGRIVVGVGNIYASEALFRSGIRPNRAAGGISRARLDRLAQTIKQVLDEAIQQGGTTISDYRGSGEGGLFQQRLLVYGRAEQPCTVCQRPVRSVVIAGRNTFYCSRCQT
ncbi:MAG: bifunctional DNA-formamidopyrimidine glycosylase/DNA-(apurinic or apyrimidinic site) lyase [Candidatus Latescibacteria bacterium]|nr:bifunctional DNA-formamidopyrimidine glycosylase/DNA-(apurinic or apyrimidinic site) lyase [Candidatus Latescibacterota bacterium]